MILAPNPDKRFAGLPVGLLGMVLCLSWVGCSSESPDSDCVRQAKSRLETAKQQAEDEWTNANEVISGIGDRSTRLKLREEASESRSKKFEVADSVFEDALAKCEVEKTWMSENAATESLRNQFLSEFRRLDLTGLAITDAEVLEIGARMCKTLNLNSWTSKPRELVLMDIQAGYENFTAPYADQLELVLELIPLLCPNEFADIP